MYTKGIGYAIQIGTAAADALRNRRSPVGLGAADGRPRRPQLRGHHPRVRRRTPDRQPHARRGPGNVTLTVHEHGDLLGSPVSRERLGFELRGHVVLADCPRGLFAMSTMDAGPSKYGSGFRIVVPVLDASRHRASHPRLLPGDLRPPSDHDTHGDDRRGARRARRPDRRNMTPTSTSSSSTAPNPDSAAHYGGRLAPLTALLRPGARRPGSGPGTSRVAPRSDVTPRLGWRRSSIPAGG